jgi:hypothetical protein
MVPKKAGSFTIPALEFSYFNPSTKSYKTAKTTPHVITVLPGKEGDQAYSPDDTASPVPGQKPSQQLLAKDIRYIRNDESGPVGRDFLHRSSYRLGVLALILAAFVVLAWGRSRRKSLEDLRGTRLRRSHALAKRKLHGANKWLRQGKKDEFYAEIQRAVNGFFADKMNVKGQSVTTEMIQSAIAAPDDKSAAAMRELASLNDALAMARFARAETTQEDMKEVYRLADKVITQFDKVKFQ